MDLLYKRIIELKNTNEDETKVDSLLLTDINYKSERGKISRSSFNYLSLLANEKFICLTRLIQDRIPLLKPCLDNMSELADFIIYKRLNWISNFTYNEKEANLSFRRALFPVLFAKCLEPTYNDLDAYSSLVDSITDLFDELTDEFWKRCGEKIIQLNNMLKLCKKWSVGLHSCQIMYMIKEFSMLKICSYVLDLWQCISEELLLELQQLTLPEDAQLLAAFAAIIKIFNALIDHIPEKTEVDEIERIISTIQDNKLKLEMLENIFGMLFIRSRHLHDEIPNGDNFLCGYSQIKFVIFDMARIFGSIHEEQGETQPGEVLNLYKHLTQARWKYELLLDLKLEIKEELMMKYMLASPKSLVRLCLKKGHFERAYEVIKVYNADSASTVLCFEALHQLKYYLREKSQSRTDDESQRSPLQEEELSKRIEKFVTSRISVLDGPPLPEDCSSKDLFSSQVDINESNLNMLDLILLFGAGTEDCEHALQIIEKSSFINEAVSYNIKGICESYKDVGHKYYKSFSDFILSDQPFVLEECSAEEVMFKNLETACTDFLKELTKTEYIQLRNNNHNLFGLIVRINSLITNNLYDKTYIEYLLRLFSYLKHFSRICSIGDNENVPVRREDIHLSNLLTLNRVEILGKLLFKMSFTSNKFEQLFDLLDLDYLYHVVANLFPTINLHFDKNISTEEFYPENKLFLPNYDTMKNVLMRNWLLGFLLDEMYGVIKIKSSIDVNRIKYFLNYVDSPKMQYYKECFFNSEIVAVLKGDIDYNKLKKLFNYSAIENNGNLLQCLRKIYHKEAAEKPLASILRDLLDYMPEKQLNLNEDLVQMKDMMLQKLINEDPIYFSGYVRLIDSRDLRLKIILDNLNKWQSEFSLSVIRSEITHYDGPPDQQIELLTQWSSKIELYTKLEAILGEKSWTDALKACNSNPKDVVEKIILTDEIDILLDFIRIQHEPPAEILEAIDEVYFLKVFTLDPSFIYPKIQELLELLPSHYAIRLCNILLRRLKKLPEVQLICDCLSKISRDARLRIIQLSLKILERLKPTPKEQEAFICLIEKPLSIVESLIMNTKLDKLSPVLTVIREECNKLECSSYEDDIDELLRKYAEKALYFPRLESPPEVPAMKLLQSVDSFSTDHGTTNSRFIMPAKVPSKGEWIMDNEIITCMCCKVVTFSMFNRRHHCRRCGRMICYICSMNMTVVSINIPKPKHKCESPEYGNVLVRVCQDCYQQTYPASANDEGAEKQLLSLTRQSHHEFWTLTEDEDYNRIIRQEFSFENVPSVSLCLSILKYHSHSLTYYSFLLQQCEHMLSVLQIKNKGEIDVFLVIQMLKALATAIKMARKGKYHHDPRLVKVYSKIDILELLADHGCMSLIPIACTVMDHLSNTAVLTDLRDILVDKEQWKLALEVSAKLGLDKKSVYVAWGRTCLLAGKLLEAREKFRVCLNKKDILELGSPANRFEQDHRPNTSRASFHSKRHLFQTTPIKSNSLLTDIIDVLETKMYDPIRITRSNDSVKVLDSKTDLAQYIGDKLDNMGYIANACYFKKLESEENSTRNYDRIYYNECLHYLTAYGSAIDLLHFFVKHGEMEKVLKYIRDTRLSSDYFIEVYTVCLTNGVASSLLSAMLVVDSSFTVFKGHLKSLCQYLEDQGYFYSLYQLQKFMGDYIRAAVSCIHFYEENVTNYSDLVSRSHFLHKALEHLKYSLEQDEWVEVTQVEHSDHDCSSRAFEEKSPFDYSLLLRFDSEKIHSHINTVTLQMEVAEFLSKCELLEQDTMKVLRQLKKMSDSEEEPVAEISTLFGNMTQKTVLAALVIVCSCDVQDGFNLSEKLVKDYKLRPQVVLQKIGKYLAETRNLEKIIELAKCIHASSEVFTIEMCDKVLLNIVEILVNSTQDTTEKNKEDIIKYIVDKEIKVSAYIEAKQLKSAYFLAAKYKRFADLRRILQAAEELNVLHIKSMCQKILETGNTANYI